MFDQTQGSSKPANPNSIVASQVLLWEAHKQGKKANTFPCCLSLPLGNPRYIPPALGGSSLCRLIDNSRRSPSLVFWFSNPFILILKPAKPVSTTTCSGNTFHKLRTCCADKTLLCTLSKCQPFFVHDLKQANPPYTVFF